VLYLMMNVVFIYAAPLEDLKGKLAVGAFAASRLFGPQIAGIFSALMALSLMATVNAMVTIGPRVYYAMAKNGAFLARAAEVHPRWHTPVAAIVAQGICTMLMTLTPFPQLAVYIGFMLNFFAVMSVVALCLLRRRPGWRKLRVVSFCYPLFPALFVLVGCWMIFYGVQMKPVISLAAVVTVVTGALVYHVRLKSHAPKAPVVETY
jgi:basic amino acid/polyamine antiporter, APA family